MLEEEYLKHCKKLEILSPACTVKHSNKSVPTDNYFSDTPAVLTVIIQVANLLIGNKSHLSIVLQH
jgi:hypothetical protein